MSRPGMTRPWLPRHAWIALLAALVLVAAACSEQSSSDDAAGGETGSEETGPAGSTSIPECVDESIVACAPDGTAIDDLIPEAPVTAEGEPIRIGMMNTDTGAATAFPELTLGTEAGVRWLNEEMGGVDGRPIELVACDVAFSPTGSQSCGQQMVEEDVVAVLGGLDVFGDGIQVLEDNGIPLVGGVPVSAASVESPISFQFSGGSWGQNLGLVHHITEVLEAESVSMIYGDFGSVADGAEWARRSLIGQGLSDDDIHMIPIPIVAEDVLAPLTVANEPDPDAIIVLVGGQACTAAAQAIQEIGITAQTYWSGTCLEPTIVDTIGAENVEGNIYGIESPLDVDDPDNLLYNEVVERYGNDTFDAGSVATVSFASLMNLYAELREIGADDISAEAIVEQLAGAVDRPSFLGHPYTCDGQQMGGELPAICSPQQILAQMVDGELVAITDWIQVADLIEPAT